VWQAAVTQRAPTWKVVCVVPAWKFQIASPLLLTLYTDTWMGGLSQSPTAPR